MFGARDARHVASATATGFGLRAGAGWLLGPRPVWDGVLYQRAARQLAAGEGYTQRIYEPDWWPSPTAFFAPGWPAALAAWKSLGLSVRDDLLLQAMLGSAAIPVAAWLARRTGGRVVSLTAWGVALWPGGVLGAASWMTEPLFGLLLLLALVPLSGEQRAPLRLVASAALFGLASLVRPTALAVAPVVLGAWASLQARGTGRRRLAEGVVGASCVVVSAAVVCPWVLRNVALLDTPALTTSAAANLHVGVHGARFSRIPASHAPRRGVLERTRERLHRDAAASEIAEDPLSWLGLAPLKVAYTFAHESNPALAWGAGHGLGRAHPAVVGLVILSNLFWWALVALAIRGTDLRGDAVTWSSLLALAAVHAVFFGGDRYHLPWVPLLVPLAARGVVGGRPATTRGPPAIESTGRLVGI